MHDLIKGLSRATVSFLRLLLATAGVATAHAALPTTPQSSVSGVIVHQLPIPSVFQRITRQAVYTASPSIAVLPDGAYLIACNDFGHGSTAATSGLTYLYRADDRIYLAIGGRRMISAPIGANLLQADAWTLTPAPASGAVRWAMI